MIKNITQYEIPLLSEDFNLTDGHVYRRWSPQEEEIIDRVSEIFRSVNRQIQVNLEKEYITTFLTLAHQTIDFKAHKYLLCNSASMGIEIIANYLRLNNISLSLIEPCFDNLADIYKRHRISLEPFPDNCLDKPNFTDFLENITSDAICLVTPNNPTGKILVKDNFLALVDFCKKKNKLLILDCCFRAYIPEQYIFDQYNILKDSGVDYIFIEDTGKTWSVSELKAPFLTISASLYQAIFEIYTDLILHVSPFVIKLLTEFIKNSIKENKEKLSYSQYIIDVNRECLYRNIENTILTPFEKPYISVSWLKVNGMTGFQLMQILKEKGIHILPGDLFYWSNHDKGKQFIRIALTRDPEIFAQAAALLGNTCRELTESITREELCSSEEPELQVLCK